jgi:predicted lipoprotein with Yx(FWY)xxD motif
MTKSAGSDLRKTDHVSFLGRFGWRRLLVATLSVVLALGLVFTYASSKSGPRVGAVVSVLTSKQYGTVLVVGGGKLSHFPLYEFSGDVNGHFGCGTTLAKGYDFNPDGTVPLTCTGPESDLFHSVASDDWPAFTSSVKPVAGHGVTARLLSRVFRPGIGEQVTYAGHPLYLFDPSSVPFVPAGEDYGETVAPLAPWHGYWSLVSAHEGEPATGTARLERATLSNGTTVLGVERDVNLVPVAVDVYELRGQSNGSSPLSDLAPTWVPLLSSSAPKVTSGVKSSEIGEITLANGTRQITYKGRPLFLYSREIFLRRKGAGLVTRGTSGNGDGVAGPGGVFSLIPLG